MTELLSVEEHERLLNDGWRYRFSGLEPRVSEMKEFYEDMGLETLVRPGSVEAASDCSSCMTSDDIQQKLRTVYTRGVAENLNRADDDLF